MKVLCGRFFCGAEDHDRASPRLPKAIDQRPAAGDSVQVIKGAFGGYLCKVTRWQSIRCQRDE